MAAKPEETLLDKSNSEPIISTQIPPCGHCGYDSTGLVSFCCAECGNRLVLLEAEKANDFPPRFILSIAVVSGIPLGCLIFLASAKWALRFQFGLSTTVISAFLNDHRIAVLLAESLISFLAWRLMRNYGAPIRKLSICFLGIVTIIALHAFFYTMIAFNSEYSFF